MGGAFCVRGADKPHHCIAALLSRMAGRTVKIRCSADETIDHHGPFGAKEVGQGPIPCTTQAIANAVSNAIGYPLKELPITPERVLHALDHKRKT